MAFVVAMGGYFGNTIAVKAGGSGNVTESHRVWNAERTRTGIGSGVVHDGHIYIVNASGIADCIELKTGKNVWSERVRGSGPKSDTWSSSVLVGDLVYHLNQSGDCVVFRASPKFEIVGANSIGNELCNASVAVSNGGDLHPHTQPSLVHWGDEEDGEREVRWASSKGGLAK